MDAITAINQRTSVRRFRSDPVPREIVERLLDCAVRAPNHKLTEPWRFTVLTGRAKDRFAEIRAKHRLKRYSDPATPEALAGADKVRRESQETPVYIVAMAAVNPDEITREEDYAATMMAIANLMIAAESLGLGTYLKIRWSDAGPGADGAGWSFRRVPRGRLHLARLSRRTGSSATSQGGSRVDPMGRVLTHKQK